MESRTHDTAEQNELEKAILIEDINRKNVLISKLEQQLAQHKKFIRKYAAKEFTEDFFYTSNHLCENFITFIQLASESGTEYDLTFVAGSTIRTFSGFKSDFESEDQTYGRNQFPKSSLGEFVLPIPKDLKEFRNDLQQLEK